MVIVPAARYQRLKSHHLKKKIQLQMHHVHHSMAWGQLKLDGWYDSKTCVSSAHILTCMRGIIFKSKRLFCRNRYYQFIIERNEINRIERFRLKEEITQYEKRVAKNMIFVKSYHTHTHTHTHTYIYIVTNSEKYFTNRMSLVQSNR